MTADTWFFLRAGAAQTGRRSLANGFLVQQYSTALRHGPNHKKRDGIRKTGFGVADFWHQIPTSNVIALTGLR